MIIASHYENIPANANPAEVVRLSEALMRDLFAAFALAGILSQPNGDPLGNPHDLGLRWCATTAYGLADAMLSQRREGVE